MLGEYAFGGQPQISNDGRVARPVIKDGRLQVEFLRRISGTHELLYELAVAPDLVTWSALGFTELESIPVPEKPGFERVTVQVDTPMSAAPSIFVRLKASLP